MVKLGNPKQIQAVRELLENLPEPQVVTISELNFGVVIVSWVVVVAATGRHYRSAYVDLDGTVSLPVGIPIEIEGKP